MTTAAEPKKLDTAGETVLTAMPLSPGIAVAPVRLHAPDEPSVPLRRIEPDAVLAETERLEQALLKTRGELHALKTTLGGDSAAIFDAHLLAVDDPDFLARIHREICDGKVCAEHAVFRAGAYFANLFSRMEDDYLKERANDIRDVVKRIVHALAEPAGNSAAGAAAAPAILVAKELAPSEAMNLRESGVAGLVVEGASPTSHVAILTRALGIPAVTRLSVPLASLPEGAEGVLDGTRGTLTLRPTEATRAEKLREKAEADALRERLAALKDETCTLVDGKRVGLEANLDMPRDAEEALQCGAEGVGLYRTEYLFLDTAEMPGEEKQFAAYAHIARLLAPRRVVLRTLDLGGDKLSGSLNLATESNPFLGWRAIRLCLGRTDIFRTQLRAMLRASALNPNLEIMYPMISRADEIDRANALLAECKEELRGEGKEFNENVSVGVMVEIPAAALIARDLARKVAFFSIGTNDLTQYTLAVDRGNEQVAHLYDPLHPAVLRLISETIAAGEAAGIETGVCGEMAGQAVYAPLLVGMGAKSLSASPRHLPTVKAVLRALDSVECKELARAALQSTDGLATRERCRALIARRAPDLLPLVD
jgi:phosphotransferase system enzyme I (PtsI)